MVRAHNNHEIAELSDFAPYDIMPANDRQLKFKILLMLQPSRSWHFAENFLDVIQYIITRVNRKRLNAYERRRCFYCNIFLTEKTLLKCAITRWYA